MKKTFKNSKKGFTLLETLVAVFILSLALTGPIYIATLAIRGSVESRDNISAYFLAEEAVEYIRNIRDTNSLRGIDWLESMRDCHVTVGTEIKNICVLTRPGSGYQLNQCGGDCPALSFDPNTTPVYGGEGKGSASITTSKFVREIYLEDRVPNKEVDVHVTVKWVEKGRDRQFKIVQTLFNQDYSKYYEN